MKKLMAHLIPYFPDLEGSFKALGTLLSCDLAYIEIQFPFTDPTADGPRIEAACQGALRQGYVMEEGFHFVEEASRLAAGMEGGERPKIFVMSYANPVFVVGVKNFVARAKAAGAAGLIVPDLALGSDEGLFAACAQQGLACIPVLVPGILPERLKLVLQQKCEYLYCALRTGITGSDTRLSPELLKFLDSLSKEAKVLGGFGIKEAAQVRELAPHVHATVVGSALLPWIERKDFSALKKFVIELAAAA